MDVAVLAADRQYGAESAVRVMRTATQIPIGSTVVRNGQ